jgi:hypothetical protein
MLADFTQNPYAGMVISTMAETRSAGASRSMETV